MIKEYTCKCGSKEMRIISNINDNKKGLYCINCGKWQKWISKEEARSSNYNMEINYAIGKTEKEIDSEIEDYVEQTNEILFGIIEFKNQFISHHSRLKSQGKKVTNLIRKLMIELSPTKHDLDLSYQEKFMIIIYNNLDKSNAEIRKLLKECWDK